jgi:hypothetical protein
MEGRNAQIVDEDIMETASVAPPDTEEGYREGRQTSEAKSESTTSSEAQDDRQPPLRPPPD